MIRRWNSRDWAAHDNCGCKRECPTPLSLAGKGLGTSEPIGSVVGSAYWHRHPTYNRAALRGACGIVPRTHRHYCHIES